MYTNYDTIDTYRARTIETFEDSGYSFLRVTDTDTFSRSVQAKLDPGQTRRLIHNLAATIGETATLTSGGEAVQMVPRGSTAVIVPQRKRGDLHRINIEPFRADGLGCHVNASVGDVVEVDSVEVDVDGDVYVTIPGQPHGGGGYISSRCLSTVVEPRPEPEPTLAERFPVGSLVRRTGGMYSGALARVTGVAISPLSGVEEVNIERLADSRWPGVRDFMRSSYGPEFLEVVEDDALTAADAKALAGV